MIAQQKQSVESFVRVQAFVDAHPVTGPLTYAGARETLDEVVQRLREYAGAQVTGRGLSRGELRRQAQLMQQLIDRHMRPLVAVARAQTEPESDVRLPAAIVMPRNGLGVTKLLQASDGMIAAARPFEATFVANGLPADFLERFTAARDELAQVHAGRATHVGAHIAARAGMQVQVRRGRRAVGRIDAVVRASFDGDEMTLAAWRAAKRLHQTAGGAGARGAGTEAPEEAAEQLAPELKQAA